MEVRENVVPLFTLALYGARAFQIYDSVSRCYYVNFILKFKLFNLRLFLENRDENGLFFKLFQSPLIGIQ